MTSRCELYLISNDINDKVYVGVSKHTERRFAEHSCVKRETKSVITNAMKLYGKEHFSYKILLVATREYCLLMEKELIDALDCRSPNGYNITKGGLGNGGLFGEQNGCYGRSGHLNPQYGKTGKEAAHYGRKHTEETRRKMSESRTGLKRTPEQKEKCRMAAIIRWQRPEYRKNVMMAKYGRVHNKNEEIS